MLPLHQFWIHLQKVIQLVFIWLSQVEDLTKSHTHVLLPFERTIWQIKEIMPLHGSKIICVQLSAVTSWRQINFQAFGSCHTSKLLLILGWSLINLIKWTGKIDCLQVKKNNQMNLQMNLNKANGIKKTLFLAFKGGKMQYNKQDKTVRFLKNISQQTSKMKREYNSLSNCHCQF